MKTQLFALAILVLPGVAAADAVNDSFTRMLAHQPTASAAATNDERLVENWVNAAVRGDAAAEAFARMLEHQAAPRAVRVQDERVVENRVNAAVRGDTDAAADGYARLLHGGGEAPSHEPVHGEPDAFATAVREALQAEPVDTAIASAP